MKSIYNLAAVLAISALLCVMPSCTKNFEKINTDPSTVTQDMVKVDALLTQVMKNSVFGGLGGNVAEWMNYITPGDGGYPFLVRDFSGLFDGHYKGYLNNMEEVIRLTNGVDKLSNKNAIAKIFRVWLWQTLTDTYGDIPFTQATQGVQNVILQPKYDTQESIYTQLFDDLKNATAQLSSDPSKDNYGSTDLIFGGDVDSWKRFANSLRLRMAVRVSYVNKALAQSNINDVIGGLIVSDDQSAKLLSTDFNVDPNMDNWNPFVIDSVQNYINGYAIGFTPVELMATNNDPRVGIYFNKNPMIASGWRGRPISISGAESLRYSNDSLSQAGNFFRASRFRFNVISAAEVYFLRAEAALEGLSGENAQQMYAAGIQQAMNMYNVDQVKINTFLAGPEGTLSGSTEQQLKQIIDQKYLAIMFQANEAWAEYRRTGYPLIWLGSAPTNTGGIIPRRMTYSATEYLLNEANVKEAASRFQGGDVLTARMWWDVKQGLPYPHPRQGIYPPETW